jgi:hypothetical protein
MKIIEVLEGTRCWKGYVRKGFKTMFGKRVPNCVKRENKFHVLDKFEESVFESTDESLAINFIRKNYDDLNSCAVCESRDQIGDYAREIKTGKIVRIVDYTDDDEGIYTISYGEDEGENDVTAKDLKFLDQTGRDQEEISKFGESHHSGLRAWFGKGKKGGAGGGGWDRYNTKGERIGKCGGRKKGEGKPKCLSKARAASLRRSGGKKAIAAAVRRKRRKDKNPERRGKAINVSNKKKK